MAPLDLTEIRQRMAHEPDAAIMQLRRWVDKAPGFVLARMLLAEAYGTTGRTDEAIAAWRNVKFLAPDSPLPANALSDFEAMGRTETPPAGVADQLAERGKDASETASAKRTDGPKPTVGPRDVSGHFPDPSTDTDKQEDVPAGKRRRRKKDEPPPRDFRELLESQRPPDTEEPQPKKSAEESARQQPADEEAKLRPSKQAQELSEYEDLDRLIEELESARIEPDVETSDIPGPNLDSDIDDMVSETLARIHEAQEQYAEAARIYLRLAIQEPDRAEEYKQKAAAMRERASQSGQ